MATLSNPSQTTMRKIINFNVTGGGAGIAAPPHPIVGGGYWNDVTNGNTAATGIRVFPSTGTLTAGSIYVYGYN
jgi:hypothetical protein